MPHETFVAAPQLSEIKPARPPAITLVNETYSRCGKMACIPVGTAQRALQNKVEIYSWMTNANTIMDYYEGRSAPAAPLVIAPPAKKSRLKSIFSRSKK